MTSFWGSGEMPFVEGGATEHITSGRIDLGNGHSLELHPDAIRALLHSPEAVAGIRARANAIAKSANEMSKHVGRVGRPDPEYVVEVQNDPRDTRARAKVRPGNVAAVIDNAENQTLLKALDAHPSDPKHEGL